MSSKTNQKSPGWWLACGGRLWITSDAKWHGCWWNQPLTWCLMGQNHSWMKSQPHFHDHLNICAVFKWNTNCSVLWTVFLKCLLNICTKWIWKISLIRKTSGTCFIFIYIRLFNKRSGYESILQKKYFRKSNFKKFILLVEVPHPCNVILAQKLACTFCCI